MWSYRELYSCPLTLLLGVFEYSDLKGYVIMPILNLRVNLLTTRSGEVKVYSNIPISHWREHTVKLCASIASNQVSSLNKVDQAKVYSMFYGGVGSYIVYKDELIPVAVDFVDTDKFFFYLEINSNMHLETTTSGRLEDWIIFQAALRSGELPLLVSSCRSLSRYIGSGESCTITTDLGVLRITRERLEGDRYLRVVPDNTPLRHVVVVD
ncbi:MAG: hypothetical protein LM569_02570 [Desulfurococcaceae archaeon]|nr:hypothetical protein [Desulfurococcaceae archaeon]